MARANVPKFGNWESNGDNVPYTVYFEKARKNRGGKIINPNDPQENPELFADMDPSHPVPRSRPRTRPEEPIGRGAVKPVPEQFYKNSPTRSQENNIGQKIGIDSGYGGPATRSVRSSAGSEQSFERSPLHKVVGTRESGSSPSWDGRSNDSSHATGGRYRFKPTPQREDIRSEKGTAAVPKFGAWNTDDSSSAENFTVMFNKVREERNNKNGPGNLSATTTPKHPSYNYAPTGQQTNEPKKCCFPWW